MKKLFLFVAAAAMFAACSETEVLDQAAVQQNVENDGAVKFDVYSQRGITRGGGYTGDITNKTMHGITAAVGFSYVASPNFSFRVEPEFEYFWWKYRTFSSNESYNKLCDCLSSPMIGLRFTLKYNILKEYD